MIGNAPHSPITGVPGWESKPEQELLLRYAQQVPEQGIILEIGAEFGMSASIFCAGAKASVEIISLDLFPEDIYAAHRRNLAEAGYWGRTHCLQGDSHQSDYADVWRTAKLTGDPRPIDLLFIDGDHTYEGVSEDIRRWTPFVNLGGHVVFHDVATATNEHPHALHYEIARAIARWGMASPSELTKQGQSRVGRWKSVEMVDTILVFERLE